MRLVQLSFINKLHIQTKDVSSNDKQDKKAKLMLAYPRDAKTMKKIPPFRSYNKFQSSRKSGVYSN